MFKKSLVASRQSVNSLDFARKSFLETFLAFHSLLSSEFDDHLSPFLAALTTNWFITRLIPEVPVATAEAAVF